MGRKAPPATAVNLLRGTLDLLILQTLALEQMHGLGISERIEQVSNGTFEVKPGSLFPALHRMEEAGWVTSSWGPSENNRKARYYRITRAGKKKLEAETEQWNRISFGVASILNAIQGA